MLQFFSEFTCSDNVFGAGNLGDVQNGDCSGDMVGYQIAQCSSSGFWKPIVNNCVLRVFDDFKNNAQAIGFFLFLP